MTIVLTSPLRRRRTAPTVETKLAAFAGTPFVTRRTG
jgi:hypothetical protein